MVAVGSRNPAKVAGVRRAIASCFPEFRLRSIDASKVTTAQPVGLQEIAKGASARARFAIRELRGDFGVGVEAGVFRVGNTYFDHQQAAVVDAKGWLSMGHSAGYMLPAGAVRELLHEGKELEQFAENLSGIRRIGDKGGLVKHLTGGRMNRVDLTEQCVLTALIPWFHRDLYSFDS
jgi:inosine/xanthosine triphosphatase